MRKRIKVKFSTNVSPLTKRNKDMNELKSENTFKSPDKENPIINSIFDIFILIIVQDELVIQNTSRMSNKHPELVKI